MNIKNKIKKIGILHTIDDLLWNRISYIRYKLCLWSKRVYFGSYLAASQGNALRHWHMQKLVEHYCKTLNGKIKILEIGSWAGGSAITWAEAIKKYSRSGGSVLCVDQWSSYFDLKQNNLWTHISMEKALKTNKIYSLFLHNIAASGHGDIIFTFKGPSSQNLRALKGEQFDIIFIDADHLYDGIYNDIVNSAPLLKDGGIICGDDLELQYPQSDNMHIKELLNKDVAIDAHAGTKFHPGVTLAVWEYFKKEVSCWNGFWAVKKSGNKWENIVMSSGQGSPEIPAHLR